MTSRVPLITTHMPSACTWIPLTQSLLIMISLYLFCHSCPRLSTLTSLSLWNNAITWLRRLKVFFSGHLLHVSLLHQTSILVGDSRQCLLWHHRVTGRAFLTISTKLF